MSSYNVFFLNNEGMYFVLGEPRVYQNPQPLKFHHIDSHTAYVFGFISC